ncbi:hypothetical protein EB001_26300 [bacterium]|nr:hypothetical protein [bacterium]
MLTAEDYLSTKVCKQVNKQLANDRYKDSVFLSLKNLSSKKKGAYFESMYQEYMESKGCVVGKSGSTDNDRVVDGRKKEIKGSFLWADNNNKLHFRWQQIRPGQDYDDVVFLAFFPDRLEIYEANKETVRNAVEVQDERGNWIHNQHGGKKVNSGTFFLDGVPSDFPWMKPV